jgi:ATP-dependent Lhr-like helicase
VVGGRLARTADELLLFFQELGDLTLDEIRERSAEEGKDWLGELTARGSVRQFFLEGEERFLAADDVELFEQALGRSLERVENGRGEPPTRTEASTRALEEENQPDPPTAGSRPQEGLQQIVLRFFSTRGPAAADEFVKRYGVPAARVDEALEALRLDARVVKGRFGAPDGPPRWAGARLAESVRRKTLALLRGEIRPVPVSAWRAFVAKRQGLVLGARFSGTHAAEHALALLRGLPLPALAVEMSILPARLAAPEPDALDVLSARGLLVWRATGAKDPRAARLSFFFRGEGAIVLPPGPPALDGLPPAARDLYGRLAVKGASFLADLAARGERGSEETLRKALVELVLAGLVTGDGVQGLREILLRRRGGRPEPSARHEPRPGAGARLGEGGTRPGRAALRATEQRVTDRLGLSRQGQASLPLLRKSSSSLSSSSLSAFSVFPSGRWSLVDAPGVFGEPLRADERAEAWTRILLARWGVVSRAQLEFEDPAAVRWSDVAPVLARMEMRGDLRRGAFVEGHGALQYAGEETIEALRARAGPDGGEPALAVAGGGDPVLAGLDPPPERGSFVVLSAGEPLLRIGADGGFTLTPGTPDRTLAAALTALQDLLRKGRDPLGQPRRLRLAAAGSPLAPLLEDLGFVRDGGAYVWRAL